jgi:hypothetical protein
MDRATDRIEQHIDREREMLRSNLEELEDRVRSAVDWRRQFRSNTAAFLGLALSGGLLIGLMTARPTGASPAHQSDHRRRALSLAWRTIESALIGVAAAKLKDTLAKVLSGFMEQLDHREGVGYRQDASARYRN